MIPTPIPETLANTFAPVLWGRRLCWWNGGVPNFLGWSREWVGALRCGVGAVRWWWWRSMPVSGPAGQSAAAGGWGTAWGGMPVGETG